MYLSIEVKVIGAIMFSLGLLTILHFKYYLFTGKAGLLLTREIHPYDLGIIWCGNLLGVCIGASLVLMLNLGNEQPLMHAAANIINTRINNLWIQNIVLGIFCGLLMYIAVTSYATKPWVTVMCVSAFILSGFNHCIADMYYFFLASPFVDVPLAVFAILCTTLGNVIGCNIIPLCEMEKERGRF